MASPEAGGTWGILGGTFDPVHNGHLSLARQLIVHRSLAGVLFVLAARHPLKGREVSAGYAFRRDMLDLGLADQPNLRLSEIEKEKRLSGYSIDTVETLKRQYPESDFVFIIGADNLESLPDWHRADELIGQITFLVGTRPPVDSLMVPDKLKGHVDVVDIEPVDISSTQVRQRVSEGIDKDDLTTLVPARVAEYILRNGLYQ